MRLFNERNKIKILLRSQRRCAIINVSSDAAGYKCQEFRLGPSGRQLLSAMLCWMQLDLSYTEFLGFLLFAAVVSFEAFVLGVTVSTAKIPCAVFVICEMHSHRKFAVVRDRHNGASASAGCVCEFL